MGKVKVAVIQAASVLFDKTASIEKACNLIEKAGNKGSKIVLLPEAFIPAYPRGTCIVETLLGKCNRNIGFGSKNIGKSC